MSEDKKETTDSARENVSSILASSRSEQFLVELADLLTDDQLDELVMLRRQKMTRENDCFIRNLPRELWTMIFGYLGNKDLVSLSRTCKGFLQLGMDPKLKHWKKTVWTVTPEDLLHHPESWLLLFSRLERLELLKIEGPSSDTKGRAEKRRLDSLNPVPIKNLEINMECEWKEHPDLAVVVRLFSNLKSIDFGRSVISDGIFEIISSNSPDLEKFNSEDSVSDTGVISLTKCPNLQEIRINGERVGDQAIKMIGECCQLLTVLHIELAHAVSDLGMESVATNCRMLRELKLECARDMTDKTLDLLSRNCQIEVLTLDCCDRVTETGVRNFVEQVSKPLKLEVLEWEPGQRQPTEKEYMQTLKRDYGMLIDGGDEEN